MIVHMRKMKQLVNIEQSFYKKMAIQTISKHLIPQLGKEEDMSHDPSRILFITRLTDRGRIIGKIPQSVTPGQFRLLTKYTLSTCIHT